MPLALGRHGGQHVPQAQLSLLLDEAEESCKFKLGYVE